MNDAGCSVEVRQRSVWLAVAVAVGAAVGVGAVRLPVGASALAAVIVGVAAIALSFWRLEFGLLAILVALPLDVAGRIVEQPLPLTVFQVLLLGTLASWAVRVAGDRRGWLCFSAIDIGIACLLLAGLWSLPTSLNQPETVRTLIRLAFLWGFTLLFANGIRDEKAYRRVLWALAATGVLIGLVALAQFFVPSLDLGSVRDIRKAGGGILMSRVGAFFYDPNYLAGMMSAVFAAGLAMAMRARDRLAAVAWWATCAVTGFALLATLSRGGWIGGFAGIATVAVTAPKGKRIVLAGVLAAVALAVLAVKPDVIVSRTVSIADIQRDTSVATRYYMTDSALEMVSDHPVFGVGLGAFDQAYPNYRRPYTSKSIVRPHQVPLAVWAESGIAGLIANIALLAGIVAIWWRKRPLGWTALESAALAGTVTLLLQTGFEYYLYFEYLWLFLALSVVANRLARRAERELDA